eukprot:7388049-Prymnesium_polylepis.1
MSRGPLGARPIELEAIAKPGAVRALGVSVKTPGRYTRSSFFFLSCLMAFSTLPSSSESWVSQARRRFMSTPAP